MGSGRSAAREITLTRLGIALTVIAAILSLAAVGTRLADATWPHRIAGLVFVLIVSYLIYGSVVYQLTRLAYLERLLLHQPVTDEDLGRVYRLADAPRVTVLVPAYKEEVAVVRKTLLSAALQAYPNRRIVLLLDDPPRPSSVEERARLSAMRRLPQEIEDLLREPRRRCATAYAALRERRTRGALDRAEERRHLAVLYRDIAAWFRARAAEHAIADHVDELFVELVYRTPADRCARRAEELARRPASTPGEDEAVATGYRWLLSIFDATLTVFERKRYENLSHAANKAMNLNSYLALMGRSFAEVATPAGQLLLEETAPARADVSIADADYVLMLDADSVVHPDYTIRLVHFLEQPAHASIAVAQTPYNAFPRAAGRLERIAGATTDIQYIIHQGFTAYGATFWVGANALVRKRALEDIAVADVERGYAIRKFIQDRTVIEDTESTVDLIDHGWQLYNHPERLAFSATPPDFGALVIQRRRWANGGLIILPKLLRHVGRRVSRHTVTEGLMRCHYLSSLAVVNIGLLVVLAVPLGDGLQTLWLPLTAIPYYALYTRDLLASGYCATDILRVYALNLMLIPVHMAGTLTSLHQAWTGRRAAFGRTPKTPGRTRAPRAYVVAELVLLAQWVVGGAVEFLHGHRLHATLALMNAAFLVYAIVAFIGLPDVGVAARPAADALGEGLASLWASARVGARRA